MRTFLLSTIISLCLISCAEDTLEAIVYINEVVRTTNEQGKLPRKLDENTIAELVRYDHSNSTIIYTYKCLDITSETINRQEIINSLKDIERGQRKRVVNEQGKDKAYQKLQISIKSIYLDAEGKEFYSFTIKPDEYLNSKNSINNQDYPDLVFVGGRKEQRINLEEYPYMKIQSEIQDFHIGKTEVTVSQYRKYCEKTGVKMPSEPKWGWNENEPIVNISWQEAVDYCDWLSEELNLKISLPTPEQWEYAAMGGTLSQGNKYSGGGSLPSVGWYSGNSNGKPHSVNLKQANELGLVDMSGNVSEWCWCSSYERSKYDNTALNKGGSWKSDSPLCLIESETRDYQSNSIGFRIVSD